ncbi:MAG: glycosyltransferase [Crocinitomicaceae bacterium]|nr:glycosyltransferase [Crocinitomicaceae bacterium]
MKIKKIVFLIPSLEYGGMERVMSLLLNVFAKKNVQLHLILYGKTREVKYNIPDSVIIHRPTFSYSATNRFIFTLKTLLYLRKEIKKIKPNSILSFGEYWNNLVLISLYGLRYPVYISDRSQPNLNLGKIQNKLRDFLYPKAKGYIAQTLKAAEIAKKNEWNSNITVIGNPIREVADHPEIIKQNYVLTVGRLIKTKHVDDLIKIFAQCNMADWKLIIVGGNPNKIDLLMEYKSLVKELNLESRVKLVGAQKNVDEYYRKSKVFAFTSSSEGFPNVIGEAMSAGLPVIAYDCLAGPSDMIDQGVNGYLIPLFDSNEFKTKLNSLMQNEEKRTVLGQNAAKINSKFNLNDIADAYYNFILKD